jgi:hypothetical protein
MCWGWMTQTDEMVLVVDRGSGNGPVRPLSVWGLYNVQAVCLDVLATIGRVEERAGQRSELGLVCCQLVVLAWPRFDHVGRNRGLVLAAIILSRISFMDDVVERPR